MPWKSGRRWGTARITGSVRLLRDCRAILAGGSESSLSKPRVVKLIKHARFARPHHPPEFPSNEESQARHNRYEQKHSDSNRHALSIRTATNVSSSPDSEMSNYVVRRAAGGCRKQTPRAASTLFFRQPRRRNLRDVQ